MIDAIGSIDVSAALESGSNSESSSKKSKTSSYPSVETRIKFVQKMALVEPKMSTYAVYHAMKKKYGVGMATTVIKDALATARKGNPKMETKRNKRVERKARREYMRRERFAEKMLQKMPEMTHVNLNKLAVRKFGKEITDTIFQKYSTAAKPQKSFKEKTMEGVKASLRTGTTPLKTEAKKMGQFFVACGVEQATFKVVDGVPQWEITEKHVTVI